MRNLRDPKTKVFPSTTRTGKELPSSSSLDSPSVLTKFATPSPARNFDVSLVLDDATSAIHDACDDAFLDTALPLGAFLDAQIARVAAECDDTSETAEIIEVEPVVSPVRTSSPRCELPDIPEGYVMEGEIAEDFLAFVAHLTKLHDIATLFTSEEKIRHYYILKVFPFSLKDDAKTWFTSLAPSCVRNPQDMIYYFSEKYFPAHKKQAALQEICNFVQVEEESLPQAWRRLVQLLNALPYHPLEKNEIVDIFYNGLTEASRDHLDSCAGCVFRERTVEQAGILFNNILCNENAWTIPEPPPKPTPKKIGILFLSPEDMQEAKKSMKEKGIKSEDVKYLPPIKEIHGLDNPTQVVEVNSLRRFSESDIPFDKPASLCLDEFDNFVAKQQSFNDYVSTQLEQNARMLSHFSACVDRNINDLKFLSKHASVVTTQVEQVLKAQNDLLNELNDNSLRVVTRGGRMTQEPLYPEGHPKRIEQDSQGVSTDAPSHHGDRKKKTDDRNLHASKHAAVTPENPNDISVSDAETQSGDEHDPSDNIDSGVRDDAQPSNDNDVEIERAFDLDNPQPKNRRYDKNDFIARKHDMLKMYPYAKYMKDIVTNKRKIPEVKWRYYITKGEAEEYEREAKVARLREAAIQAVAAALPYNPHYDCGYRPDQPWE
ncbi:hypothetical protein ZWY2020_010711 [Hordeum vulgare]|nr:hypothetical protein ZWY2020_010711 [Hordeum vulgare]